MSHYVHSTGQGRHTHYGQVIFEWTRPSWVDDLIFFAFVIGTGKNKIEATVGHASSLSAEAQDDKSWILQVRYQGTYVINQTIRANGHADALNEASTILTRAALEGKFSQGKG